MNPAFWLLIVVLLIIIWALLSFAFKPIGKLTKKFWRYISGKDDYTDD